VLQRVGVAYVEGAKEETCDPFGGDPFHEVMIGQRGNGSQNFRPGRG
jgi:hypothetical protein